MRTIQQGSEAGSERGVMADDRSYGWKFRVTVPIVVGDTKLGRWLFVILIADRKLARERLKRDARAYLPQIQRLLTDAEIEDLEKVDWVFDECSESRDKVRCLFQEPEQKPT